MARPSGRSISMAARAFSVDRGGIVQAAGSPDTQREVHRRRLPATEGDWPGLIGTRESRREIRANQRRFPRSPRRTPVMFSLAFVVFNGPGSLELTYGGVAFSLRLTRKVTHTVLSQDTARLCNVSNVAASLDYERYAVIAGDKRQQADFAPSSTDTH
jgi:hypothetical protein